MNLERLAALIVRLTGLTFLIEGINYTTYLPYEIAVVHNSHRSGIVYTAADNALQGLWLRTGWHFLVGVALLIGWRQIVHVLTNEAALATK